MAIIEKLRKFFAPPAGKNAGKDVSGLIGDEELLDELYAKLDAYHNVAQKARQELDVSRENGRPGHELEKLMTKAKRYQKMFEEIEVEIRDRLDEMGLYEQKKNLADRYRRLTGDEPTAREVSARALYKAALRKEDELDEAEIEDEVMREQRGRQAERHRVSEGVGGTFEDDLDLDETAKEGSDRKKEV